MGPFQVPLDRSYLCGIEEITSILLQNGVRKSRKEQGLLQKIPSQIQEEERGSHRLLCQKTPHSPGQEQVQYPQVSSYCPFYKQGHCLSDSLCSYRRRCSCMCSLLS